MLERLKLFDSRRADPDEMVELHSFARQLLAEYKELGLPIPEWIEDKRLEVKRELETRLADMKAKRIREIKAKMSTLKTAAERRAELEEELKSLQGA